MLQHANVFSAREEQGQLATQRHQERAYIEEQAHVPRRCGGYAISAKLVQRTAIHKAFEYFQDETWDFGYKSGKRIDSAALKRSLNEVRDITGYDVPWRQFRDWLTYYLQFGHLPSRKKAWKGEQGRSKRLSFTANDDEYLQSTIEEQSQLHLDEIVTEMTLWKQIGSECAILDIL
ncbi:unnamed protein product [Cylindrotheca closterium]|uniref:Uncharacterized protein n=1 Tax=Cylindrotheca closterium TaxID=2856 RepID=A0AAD2CT36_9STRA|nr:unnamed protein product [Cylindrotheca closterium]